MIASLPMYDLPEIREATDGFWQNIASSYGVEGSLSREEDWTAPWRNPNLTFSQTCGYPFTHKYAGQLTYVATPHYDADGCEGPNYCSIIFARDLQPLEALRHKIVAVNDPDSMSGMLALKLAFQTQTFSHSIKTGGHIASLLAVQSKRADVCAIDCVTVALLKKYRPTALQDLIEIARSPSVPGLPYVTRAGDIAKLRGALKVAITSNHAKSLLITGVSSMASDAYNQILSLEASLNAEGRS